MPPRINIGSFVNQGPALGRYDFGAGFRDLAAQNMDQKRMDNEMTRHGENLSFNKQQHSDNLGFNKEQERNQNTRFGVTRQDAITGQKRSEQDEKSKLTRGKLEQARAFAANREFEKVDSLMGSLAELGVEVNKTSAKDGSPVYRFKYNPESSKDEYMDFDQVIGKLNGANPQQPGPVTLEEENPVTPAKVTLDEEPSASPQINSVLHEKVWDPIRQMTNRFVPPETDVNQPSAQNEPGFDPYSLDSSAIKAQVEKRLNPVLGGIVNAIPQRFRQLGANYFSNVGNMSGSPDDIVKKAQEPFETLAGLWKNQESAEAARMRASNSSENQDANRNIRLEDRMWRRTDQIGKSFDLPNVKQRIERTGQLDRLLAQNNQSADGLLISELRGMFEKGTMTDKDFVNAKEGVKTIWQQIRDGVDEKLISGGLNPDSRSGIRRFLGQKVVEDRRAVEQAQSQLMTQLQRAGSEEEAKTVVDYITGNIPQDLWAPEIKQLYGIPVEQKSGPMDKEGNYKSGSKPNSNKSSSSSSISIDANKAAEDILK